MTIETQVDGTGWVLLRERKDGRETALSLIIPAKEVEDVHRALGRVVRRNRAAARESHE